MKLPKDADASVKFGELSKALPKASGDGQRSVDSKSSTAATYERSKWIIRRMGHSTA